MAPRLAVRVKKKKRTKRNLDALESIGDLKDTNAPDKPSMFEALTGGEAQQEEPEFLPSEEVHEISKQNRRTSLVDVIGKPFAASERSLIMARHRRKSILRDAQPRSCMYFSVGHPVRQHCLTVMAYPAFDRFILLLIVANSVCLAVEDPLSDTPHPVLEQLELVFNILFTIEMTIKMIGLGLWGSKSAYWSDGWNRMDSFVVFMGWLPTILSLFMGDGGSEGANFTAIRVVRILKVLKTIQRVEGVR